MAWVASLYLATSNDGRTWPEYATVDARKCLIRAAKPRLYSLGGDNVALLHNPEFQTSQPHGALDQFRRDENLALSTRAAGPKASTDQKGG